MSSARALFLVTCFFLLFSIEDGQVFAWGDGTYCELGRLKGADARSRFILFPSLLITRCLVPGIAVSSLAAIPTEIHLIDSNGAVLPKVNQ